MTSCRSGPADFDIWWVLTTVELRFLHHINTKRLSFVKVSSKRSQTEQSLPSLNIGSGTGDSTQNLPVTKRPPALYNRLQQLYLPDLP